MKERVEYMVVYVYVVNSNEEIEKVRFGKVCYNGEYYEVRDGKKKYQCWDRTYFASRDWAFVMDSKYTIRALNEVFDKRTKHYTKNIEIGRKMVARSADKRGRFFVNFNKWLGEENII